MNGWMVSIPCRLLGCFTLVTPDRVCASTGAQALAQLEFVFIYATGSRKFKNRKKHHAVVVVFSTLFSLFVDSIKHDYIIMQIYRRTITKETIRNQKRQIVKTQTNN